MASLSKKEERIAEFIGIMLGDGSIGIYNKRSRKGGLLHQLKVTLDSRNKSYINYVSNLMREILDIEPKIFIKKNENAADIRIFNKEKVLYALNFLELKLSPKWNTMEIPKRYSKGKLALFVLRGIFDTDGSVTIFRNNGIIYPRIEIRICPSPAQNQVINILKKNNFKFKIQFLDKGNIKIRISGEKELKNWFTKVGSSNPRYIKRAEVFLKKKPL
jgi:hypothetical protein